MTRQSSTDSEDKQKIERISQNDFPQYPLSKSIQVAQAIWDNYAGKGAPPYDVAIAMAISPTSSNWRYLCGSAIAYGLTEGGYNAKEISLTPLGLRIVAPTADGDSDKAKIEAILKPRIMNEFYSKYQRAKFPTDQIAQNVLISMGLPKERTASAVQVLKDNGTETGIFRSTPTGVFVASLDSELPPPDVPEVSNVDQKPQPEGPIPSDLRTFDSISPTNAPVEKRNNRVFISHGKNKEIVAQLKDLLTFGKFEPVVSVEKETTSVPVPEKVLTDMRSCSAGVIHVMKEADLIDQGGNKYTKLNENVLIEIGAAIALYGKNFVLLVEKGLTLPSNLQGLYRIDYDGDKLDYEATIKLLRTFNEFKINDDA